MNLLRRSAGSTPDRDVGATEDSPRDSSGLPGSQVAHGQGSSALATV